MVVPGFRMCARHLTAFTSLICVYPLSSNAIGLWKGETAKEQQRVKMVRIPKIEPALPLSSAQIFVTCD